MPGLLPHLIYPLYRGLGRLAPPLAALLLARRARRGKEVAARQPERWGRSTRPRPPGPLVWLHAASVGESLAILPLIERLGAEAPHLSLLMTSTTVTSERLMAARLPASVIHQFAPMDLPVSVGRFLDHWRPDLAVYVESELWPTQLHALDRRGTTRILVNGRMSDRSYRGWRRWPGLARRLLEGFAVVTAESERSAERLRALGAPRVVTTGNLKAAAPPLPADPDALQCLSAALGDRPRWLAASTHPGEEARVFAAHRMLSAVRPDLVTLLVPRHPERGAEVAALARQNGLAVAQRSRGDLPGAETAVYLADTLGELGLFCRLAPMVFVGGSLEPIGGHNPLEPARLGAALLAGPHMENVAEATTRLEEAGALARVGDERTLAAAIQALLDDPDKLEAARRAASEVGRAEAAVLDLCWQEIAPLLPGGRPEAAADGGRG